MMKIFSVFLTTTFLSLFFNFVYAQSNVHDLLNSGDTKQLRQAARLMAEDDQNTAENLRLLANIIEQEYERAPANRIDALAWGCRALGVTGDSQYLPLLQNIYQSSTAHKKLKKYANKAYQAILASPKVITEAENKELIEKKLVEKEFQTGLNRENVAKPLEPLPINDTKGLIPKPSLTANERQLFAIARGEWQAIKYIAQQLTQIEEEGLSETLIFDALAQFLFEKHVYNVDNEQVDVLAWICRALGESTKSRYKMLLHNVAEQVTNKKLRNYALAASSSLTHTGTSYVIGSVNFQKIINEFKQGM